MQKVMNKRLKQSNTENAAEKESGKNHTVVTGKEQIFQNEILSRLKKIEGQVRGVHKMIQGCRNSGDIMIQLSAIKAAVNRVGLTVLACYQVEKLENDLLGGKEVKDSLVDFMALFKKFS